MSLKVVKLLDKLLQDTQLNGQELLASGFDWRVNENGIYVLCALGNHHYKIEDSELTPSGNKESLETNISSISSPSVNQLSKSNIMRKYSCSIQFNPSKRSKSDNIINFTSRIGATPRVLNNKDDNNSCMNKLDLNE